MGQAVTQFSSKWAIMWSICIVAPVIYYQVLTAFRDTMGPNGNWFLDISFTWQRMWATNFWFIQVSGRSRGRDAWYQILHATWQSSSQLDIISPILQDKPLHTLTDLQPTSIYHSNTAQTLRKKIFWPQKWLLFVLLLPLQLFPSLLPGKSSLKSQIP